MKNIKGRPQKRDLMDNHVRFRISEEEYSRLYYLTRYYDKSKSEILRFLIDQKFAEIMQK